jgi:hypothetical protein
MLGSAKQEAGNHLDRHLEELAKCVHARVPLGLRRGWVYAKHEPMRKSKDIAKRKPGRPKTGVTPMVGLRIAPGLRRQIEAWAAHQDDGPKLSEAIRRLVEQGLGKPKR